jgi:hypothetical protein
MISEILGKNVLETKLLKHHLRSPSPNYADELSSSNDYKIAT